MKADARKKPADPVDAGLLAEIAWCRSNRGRTGNADYERGFLEGLRRALVIIRVRKLREETQEG